MVVQKAYMALPYEMSGAMAKNRFRQEILWGLGKFLEIYSQKKDFTMIFDRVCDIEVHDDESYEFYQVKTQKTGRSFTFSQLLKREMEKKEPENQLSILGKLYLIKHKLSGVEKIKLGIVSNAPLVVKKKEYCYMSEEKICNFSDTIQKICFQILDEICDMHPDICTVLDLNNIFYAHTSMDLINPSDALLGKIVSFFHEVERGNPKKPLALLNVLKATINDKASYELPTSSYEELVKNKGITKTEFEKILDQYTDQIDLSVEKTLQFIDSYTAIYSEQSELKTCLSNIVSLLNRGNITLKNLEKRICDYRSTNIKDAAGTRAQFIKQAVLANIKFFPIEYTETEITAFVMLVFAREEERTYE